MVIIVGGSAIDPAAFATPGIDSSPGISRAMNDRIAAASVYCEVGSDTRIVSSPSDRNPTGDLRQPGEASAAEGRRRRAASATAPPRRSPGHGRRRAARRGARPPLLSASTGDCRPDERRRHEPEADAGHQRHHERERQYRGRSPRSPSRAEVPRAPTAAKPTPQNASSTPARPPASASSTLSLHEPSRQLPAAGAERDANRGLVRPAGGAHEQQVGDVRAGHEQHEPDGAHQHQQRRPGVADGALAHRDEPQTRVRIGVGVGGFARAVRVRDGVHFPLRLLDARARPKARHRGR